MRVSLSLYRQPNFASSRIIQKESKEAENIKPDEFVCIDNVEDSEASGFIPVVIPAYRFYEPVLKPKKPLDFDANIELLNSYIVGTEPHEDFDPYPVTKEELIQDEVVAISKVALKCKSPRELVQYYTDYYYDITKNSGGNDNKMRNFTFAIEDKIDFDKLGLNVEDMSVAEKMKFAALYDFWGVRLEGSERNGHKRPDFIKSPAEFLEDYTLQEINYPHYLKFLEDVKKRLCPEQREEAKKFDEAVKIELEQQKKEIKRDIPFILRNLKPIKTPSAIGRMEQAVQQRHNELAPKCTPKYVTYAPEYDPDLDMAKAWHEFIGGEWD